MVALITVLSLGSLILIISISSSLLAYWLNQNIDSNFKALKAYYAAYSGLQDALIKLERIKISELITPTSAVELTI